MCAPVTVVSADMPAWGSQTNGSWHFNYIDAYIAVQAPKELVVAPAS